MTFGLDPTRGLISVRADVTARDGTLRLKLALDTAASQTLINAALLFAIGCRSRDETQSVTMATASGLEFVPTIPVARLAALGHEKLDFPVLSHTLPPSVTVDGVLGLDFLRGRLLTIDFRSGRLSLE